MELYKVAVSQLNGNDHLSDQMETFRDQLGPSMRIADRLARPSDAPAPTPSIDEQHIRRMLKLRRSRDRFFTTDLFADPAWDILLELYAAALGQFRISVSNLCIGAAVPATTALRWIKQLEGEGLIDRRSDPIDGRRQFLMLSDNGIEAMHAYFRTVPASATLI